MTLPSTTTEEDRAVVVAAMYRFVYLQDYVALRERLLAFCLQHDIKGTILLAEEGINGTVAASRHGIDALLQFLRADSRLAKLAHKESLAEAPPFLRMKVKLKREIVTMGVADTDPSELNGVRVGADEWNELISDPDVIVIDTRNQYEHGIGTFANAVSPETQTFREFPDFVANSLDPQQHQKVAMFCTGGIRCEKATNYLLKLGFPEVFHLDGGILKYLEEVDPKDSLWRGECFVFDDRVSVDGHLNRGSYEQCSACRWPVSEEDRRSPHYEPGISCARCIKTVSDEKRLRLAERRRQVELASAQETTESEGQTGNSGVGQ